MTCLSRGMHRLPVLPIQIIPSHIKCQVEFQSSLIAAVRIGQSLRRLLSLPRVGQYDLDTKLPFTLVTNDRDRPNAGRHVVEVHPAVALWRWCMTEDYSGPWEYKKDRQCKQSICKLMSQRLEKDHVATASDDELDAWIAWYLARCWLSNSNVALLGNAQTGSFLLPFDPALQEAFEQFSRT